MTGSNAYAAIDAVWRIESARVIASLTRIVRDVGLAEDFAQEALVAALERWPQTGIPDKPGAWLLTTARYRAIDFFRKKALHDRLEDEIVHDLELRTQRDRDETDGMTGEQVGDDLLRLVFISCHPILPPESRVALTLRLLGGLTTQEIARAFLSPEPTVAQRIVRAKRTLREARVPFELVDGDELAARLASVLEVIYLIFNEGYSATSGGDWIRPALCEDALRLGRILQELAPQEPEVHGLAALMEIQASRLGARTAPNGDPILLLDQNRSRWDHLLIRRGLAALERAESLGAQPGPYTLQAAIAACHARARTAEETDWRRIAGLYDELSRRTPSPIIDLNRAVALSMAFGPAVGLELIDKLIGEPALKNYHLLPAVRADLLAKLGRADEARAEFERAASMTQNEQERRLMLKRAAECGNRGS